MDSRSRSDKTQHKYDLPEPLESQPMKLCPTCQPRYECSHLGLEETPRWKLAAFWMTVLPVAWKALAFCTANPPKSCWKIDYDQLLSDMLEPDQYIGEFESQSQPELFPRNCSSEPWHFAREYICQPAQGTFPFVMSLAVIQGSDMSS